jgi:EamA domain-containing membrane protein RarD
MAMNQEQQKQIVMVVVAAGIFGYIYFSKLLKPVQAEIVSQESELASVNSRIESLRVTANQRDQLIETRGRPQSESGGC